MLLPDKIFNSSHHISLFFTIPLCFAILGCGSADDSVTPSPEDYTVITALDNDNFTVKQTESVTLTVDITSDAPANISLSVAGYTIDMPEAVSGINIDTGSCASGIGSTSCQEWTITPAIDSIPGSYSILVTPNSPNQSSFLVGREFRLIVTADELQKSAPAAISIGQTSNAFHILTRDQKRWSWGNEFVVSNRFGNVGVGGYFNNTNEVMPDNVNIAAPDNSSPDWANVAGSNNHGLSLTTDGIVRSWGLSSNALGYSTTENQMLPRPISDLSNVSQVATSLDASLAIVDGEVIVWGSNEFGLYGNGTQETSSEITFNTVQGLTDIIEISAGLHHALALASDGRVYAWGDNSEGQLGAGSDAVRTQPIQVLGFTNITQISAAGKFSLALQNDGTVWSWGENNDGQLGIGSRGTSVGSPQQVRDIGSALEVSAMYSVSQSMGFMRDEATRLAWRWGGDIDLPAEIPLTVRTLGSGLAVDVQCDSGGFLWDLRPSPTEPPRLISIFGKDDSGCPNKLFLNYIGMGSVTATPPEDNIVEGYIEPTDVVLTATPDPGWQIDPLEPWVDNEDCNDGMVNVKGGVQCIAKFIPADNTQLSVSKFGTGDGVITSDLTGINCGTTCTANFSSGETIALTATADMDSDFTGWAGTGNCATPDSIIDNVATITLTEASDCQASFNKKSFVLTVSKNGSGDGAVVSDITAIDCGNDCDASLDINTQVTLTPIPAASSTFASWSGSGDCENPATLVDNSISITVSQDSECIATFDPTATGDFVLTVIITGGPHAGEVFSSETPTALMQCLNSGSQDVSTTCSVPYSADSSVTLVADVFFPNNTLNVTGCDSFVGTNPDCFVTMDEDKTVTFDISESPEYDITTTITGNGSIISFAAGGEVGVTGRIECPSVNCNDTFVVPANAPSRVTFEAHPTTGSTFVNWGVGQCDSESMVNEIGICQVNLDPGTASIRQVDATFQ